MPSCISTCKLNKRISKLVQNRLHITQSHFGFRNDGALFYFSCWQVWRLSAMLCHSYCCVWHCQVWNHFIKSCQTKEGWWQGTNHWVWESAKQLLYMEWHLPLKEILMSSKWIRKYLSWRIGHDYPAICLQNLALLWIGNDKLMSTVAVWSPSCSVWTWYWHPGGKTALNKM